MPTLADYPRWCTTNPVDPGSGQPAILTPSAGKIASGILREEFPPRQDFNYLFNKTGDFWGYFISLMDGYIDGFRLMENPAVNQVTISAGRCVSDQGQFLFDTNIDSNPWVDNKITKEVLDPFVAGNGNGGLASNLVVANFTHYHGFVVELANGDLDVGYDSDPQAANLILADGVQNYRRIHTLFNEGVSNILDMRQYGDYFKYEREPLPIDNILLVSGNDSVTAVSAYIPTGITTLFDLRFNGSWAAGTQLAKALTLRGDVSISGGVNHASAIFDLNIQLQDSDGITSTGTKKVLFDGTNNTMELNTDVVTGTANFELRVMASGFLDTRGRDWANGLNPSDNRGLFFG